MSKGAGTGPIQCVQDHVGVLETGSIQETYLWVPCPHVWGLQCYEPASVHGVNQNQSFI